MTNVVSVNSNTTDGYYNAGDTVTLTVEFSTAVDVDTTGGTPTLILNSGGAGAFVGGGGSSTLIFSYTVAPGQTSADLDYGSTSALMLNAGAITQSGTAIDAVLTLPSPGTAGSLGANADIVILTSSPTNTVASAAFSADTGTSGSDFVTKTAAQTISGVLANNLAAIETVEVSTDNGATWSAASATVGASSWSLAGVTLSQSSTLKVRVVDLAGNQGATYAQAYVLDTVAPTGVSSASLSADTGASSSDFITKTATQTISGALASNLAAGDTVLVSTDNGATWITASATVGSSAWSLAGVTLSQSDTLKVRVVDLAGNAGATYAQAYVLDTTPPLAPSPPDLDAASDTGASNTDNLTSDATPTFSGGGQANAAVVLYDTDGITVLGTGTADGSGAWSITSSVLASGPHTVSVKAVDLAGNASAASADLAISIQAAPPPPPPSVDTYVTTNGSVAVGDATDNRIYWGGVGADTISGGGGDDNVNGGPNNDLLQGNTGADTISAGPGADVARGGQGNDFINGNQGNDLLFGDLGDDSVAGGQGDDFLQGNQGDDVLLGDLGDDVLLGGRDNDILRGGDGADRLSGDLGDDTLTGGAGADIFSFIGGAGRDVITDFSHAEADRILLSTTQAADFQGLSGKMVMVGADTVITLGGQTIVLAGISMSSLTAGDFLFS
ncbi:Ig-like domain-containing protein [Phenylobacterium sp. Root700]|uniref:Ig-like domain-containing protein n=1 Tax=Phenylobacterium sp. Root700 TaxID=1736591 RepID=UPI0006FF2048|nr:Ig-like domain-containing protein [Phenylobacterium sp. Root700]KRB42459.1 hypothetical protein ASE02_21230 [Phenylobacterium sp. Root700]